MADGYSGAPSETDLVNLTRMWLGDKDPDRLRFTRAEIELVLSIQPSPVQAAASLARSRAAQLVEGISKSIGRTRLDLSKQYRGWLDLADHLDEQGDGLIPGQGSGVSGIRVMGITRAEVAELATDTTYQPFSFQVGMDDHVRSDRYRSNDDIDD